MLENGFPRPGLPIEPGYGFTSVHAEEESMNALRAEVRL